MGSSRNKQTVERYLAGFRRTDHEQILECLTDDITWTVLGAFHLEGKEAYDAAIEGPGFAGDPELDVVRMVATGSSASDALGSSPWTRAT